MVAQFSEVEVQVLSGRPNDPNVPPVYFPGGRKTDHPKTTRNFRHSEASTTEVKEQWLSQYNSSGRFAFLSLCPRGRNRLLKLVQVGFTDFKNNHPIGCWTSIKCTKVEKQCLLRSREKSEEMENRLKKVNSQFFVMSPFHKAIAILLLIHSCIL